MDVAYLDQNKREYEVTKHISLKAIDPISLVTLKETGECLVNLPEALFDLDYAGHYMRRIVGQSQCPVRDQLLCWSQLHADSAY